MRSPMLANVCPAEQRYDLPNRVAGHVRGEGRPEAAVKTQDSGGRRDCVLGKDVIGVRQSPKAVRAVRPDAASFEPGGPRVLEAPRVGVYVAPSDYAAIAVADCRDATAQPRAPGYLRCAGCRWHRGSGARSPRGRDQRRATSEREGALPCPFGCRGFALNAGKPPAYILRYVSWLWVQKPAKH